MKKSYENPFLIVVRFDAAEDVTSDDNPTMSDVFDTETEIEEW